MTHTRQHELEQRAAAGDAIVRNPATIEDGTITAPEVPAVIESGGIRWPNFMGANQDQIDLADRASGTTVDGRSGGFDRSAAERAFDGVNVSIPDPIEEGLTRLLVGGAILAVVIVAINAFARGAGRGAAS